MKFIFFGTPDITLPILNALKDAGYLPSAIVTAPDRPIGRHAIITPPPAKLWAQTNNIPILQPEKLDEQFLAEIKKLDADLSIVVAYGKIIPEIVITTPKLGTLNIHYSLLPKYRGASPVEAAILAGEQETGVSIQQMVFKLDAGPILAMEVVPIANDEVAPELLKKLNTVAAPLLVDTLKKIETNTAVPVVQDESGVTNCKRIEKEEGQLLATDSDEIKYRKYRAYYDWPGTFFFDKDQKRIKITKAKYENNIFIIERVVPEGKKEITYTDFLKN